MSSYAIMGLTGRVGGTAATELLKAGHQVRGIVRNPDKARTWAEQGVELAVATYEDVDSLTAAFTGVDGVFVMVPPVFAPDTEFSESRQVIDAVKQALTKAKPAKIVALSSVGSQHESGLGLITQTHLLEEALADFPAVAFLRPAWFMENAEWDVASARDRGEINVFVRLDHPLPMVGTQDIGRLAALTLQESWAGRRILELEGPRRYLPAGLANAFAEALGHPVNLNPVPRETWQDVFVAAGMPADRTGARIDMLDGFNSGWIDFEGAPAEHVVGQVTLEQVVAGLLTRSGE